MRSGIGISVPGFTRNGASPAPPPWTPASLPNLLAWWQSRAGITVGATMRTFGTGTPVVTITAAPSSVAALLIDTNGTSGARGTWMMRYSTDEGANWSTPVASAATHTLGATGYAIAIAAGSATTDNSWRSTVATWADQMGSSHPTQATAANQLLLVYNATFGRPVVRGSGGTARLTVATGGLTGDAAHSIVSQAQHASIAAANVAVTLGGSGTTLFCSWLGATAADVSAYGTGTATTPNGSTLAAGTVYRLGKTHVAASVDQGYLDGVADGSPSGARPYTLAAGFTLGARSPTGNNPTVSDIDEIVMTSDVISAPDRALLDAYLRAQYP